MDLMKGKKGLIMGVANLRSIAWGISQKLADAGEIHYVDAGYNKVGMPDPKNFSK